MKIFIGRMSTAFAWLRDTTSGRRRLARYDHPDAHRSGGPNRDAALAEHYRPGGNSIPFNGGGM